MADRAAKLSILSERSVFPFPFLLRFASDRCGPTKALSSLFRRGETQKRGPFLKKWVRTPKNFTAWLSESVRHFAALFLLQAT